VKRKIPSNAFDVYYAMGPGRSYDALAGRFQVSKQAITKLATRERWQERIAEIEAKAQAHSTQEAVDHLAEMNERHLRVLRAIQGKALDTLKTQPLRTAMDAVRALELTIRHERLIRGEPSERTEMSVEEVTKREVNRWVTLIDEGEGAEGELDDQAGG
jgi:hypothetical protein